MERDVFLVFVVGQNPMPIAVSARYWLTQGNVVKVLLLYTKDVMDIAKQIRRFLHGSCELQMTEVDDADPVDIELNTVSALEKLNASVLSEIIMNYTGGTKAMAVHAYRAAERWARDNRMNMKFEYLDARELSLRRDPETTTDTLKSTFIGDKVKISLEEMVKLHNWEILSSQEKAVLPGSAAIIRDYYCKYGVDEKENPYHRWLYGAFLPQVFKFPEFVPENKGRILKNILNREKRDSKKLKKIEIGGSETLKPLWDSIRDELELPDGEKMKIGQIKEKIHERYFDNDDSAKADFKTKTVCNWFDGLWLESVTFSAMEQVSEKLKFSDLRINFEPRAQNSQKKERDFELDVVAVKNYQLFAISCSTSQNKGILKEKLFECAIRAAQLGGDEARSALVCLSDSPREVEREINMNLPVNHKVKVFGRSELSNLSEEIEKWVKENSKGGVQE